jgi:hypothetical protein
MKFVLSFLTNGLPRRHSKQLKSVCLDEMTDLQADFHQLAVFKTQDAIHALGYFHIVSGHNGREPRGSHQTKQLLKNPIGSLGVKVAGWLISEQYFGPVGDGPRNGDTLLLPTGQFCRTMPPPVIKPQ